MNHKTLSIIQQTPERLDKILAKKYPQYTRGKIIRMIKTGAITVNDTTVKPHYIPQKGDKITIIPPQQEKICPQTQKNLDIIAENADFMVINKPCGMQVHPSCAKETDTLVHALIAHDPHIRAVGEDPQRPGIVHRLDKDTTGVMVVAKNNHTFNALKRQFTDHTVQKTYHALVFGRFDNKTGVIDAPIARAMSHKKQKIAQGKYRGVSRDARTDYRVMEEYTVGEHVLSLVEVHTHTGRMHQIRVHMKHVEHPLFGDVRYYTKPHRVLDREIRKQLSCTHDTFFLHACALSFTHDKKIQHFTAPYPQHFAHIIETLRHKIQL